MLYHSFFQSPQVIPWIVYGNSTGNEDTLEDDGPGAEMTSAFDFPSPLVDDHRDYDSVLTAINSISNGG